MKNLFIYFLIFSFTIMACDDNSTKPSPKSTSDPYALVSGQYDGYLYSTIFKAYTLDGSSYSEFAKQEFYFYDSQQNPVSPQSIKIDGNLIDNWKSNDLPYDGSNYAWEIQGNNDVSTFDYTVTGITNSTLLSPLPDTTEIDKSQGITINYQPFVGTNKVLVYLMHPAFISKSNLDSTIVVKDELFESHYLSTNTGQFELTPSMISSYPNNRYVDVTIIGYSENDTTVSGRDYRIVNGAAIEVTYKIK